MLKDFATRILKWFCHPDYYAEIQGDLEEMYQRNLEDGKRKAAWRYFFQVLGLLRPSLMRPLFKNSLINSGMFSNYFKISFRILLRQKFYSSINILGLAVGMGVCLLIYQYIHFELSYDNFHDNVENTYRLSLTNIKDGKQLDPIAFSTYALGPEGKESIPEIVSYVRMQYNEDAPVLINPETEIGFQEEGGIYVDSNFFEIFDYPILYGEPKNMLNGIHAVVITEAMATKYFGKSNPIGKDLHVSLGMRSGTFIVTGVLKNLPENTHLKFDFLLPLEFLLKNHPFYTDADSNGWGLTDFITYIKLNKNAQAEKVREKLDKLIATKPLEKSDNTKNDWLIGLQPVTDIHLKSDIPNDPAINNGDIRNIQFFAIIAIFILLMAWVNYVNLSTAYALRRAKEVGIRKAVGARRNQLINQFIVESLLINCVAALLALVFTHLTLPLLNYIIVKDITFDILQNIQFWFVYGSIIIVGALLSGLYPALILSSFKPLTSLKLKPTSTGLSFIRGLSMRRVLIVFQFLMSILLISGTYLVFRQISFMKNQDLGVDMEKILVVKGAKVILENLTPEGESLGAKYETFRNKSIKYHAVSNLSFSGSVPGKGYFFTEDFRVLGGASGSEEKVNTVITDLKFMDTYDMDFLAKTDFPNKINMDENVILNEEAMKVFGWESPDEALNNVLVNYWGDTVRILGVVKNVHWSSLKDPHAPILYILNDQWGAYFSIKMNLTDIHSTIAFLETSFHSVFPDDPFEYHFLDDDFNRQYQADLQFGNLFSAFSILAIFIACLGLFALVSYSATLRIKEIGIRKVLGASVGNLMLLLSKEYLLLMLIAILLAVPAIFFGGSNWLENYAFKIDLSADLIIIPALSLLFIAVITVSYRTYKSAKANPVNSLRKE